ncbi:MAG TPA: hypothetical protein VJ859_10385 [Allosphingosinicella sp.]|nr:hypothetical protein [Allosphingosinicella sp.]
MRYETHWEIDYEIDDLAGGARFFKGLATGLIIVAPFWIVFALLVL